MHGWGGGGWGGEGADQGLAVLGTGGTGGEDAAEADGVLEVVGELPSLLRRHRGGGWTLRGARRER